MIKTKTAKQLERHFKGVSNHHRIKILFLVNKHPGLTVEEVADRLEVNSKTISEHLHRLVYAGLLTKQYEGRKVRHHLSPYGIKMVKILRFF